MRSTYAVFGAACYAAFAVTLLWAAAFIAPLPLGWLPTIDHGPAAPVPAAVAIDLGVLALFAVQHTVMARPAFKSRWRALVPDGAERSVFVLAASAVLLLTFWQWRPLPAVVWETHGVLAAALWCAYTAGWLIVIASTFMIDHLELFGLRQSLAAARGGTTVSKGFTTNWLYRWVRHPLMSGFLVVFWAAPRMTAGHLLFAAVASAYIAIGIWFEERDSLRAIPEYAAYRRRVGSVVPRFRSE